MIRALAAILILLPALAACRLRAEQAAVEEAPAAGRERRFPVASLRQLEILAALVDPAKVDTLRGRRAANSRMRKICYRLAEARDDGADLEATLAKAQKMAGYEPSARAAEDRRSILRNLAILERLGCLDGDGMSRLRKGNAPRITLGPFAGEIVEVDQIIPRSVAPELDEKLFNLEFVPESMNRSKRDLVGARQRALARRWAARGLLGNEATARVLAK